MNSFLALRLLLTVGDLFAASALIMALAWLAPFRKTASLRHLAWVAGFGALLLLPLLVVIVPSQISFALAAPAVAAVPQTLAVPTVTVAASLPQPEAFHFDAAMLMRTLIAVWLLGVAIIMVRGGAALFGLNRLRRNSVGHVFRELPKFAQGYDIRIASHECGPVTWGFVRPIILLPQSADYWPAERVTAVLLHEIAHIRRHDSLTQMLTLLVCAFYWPNPFVWIGARAMRREAEIAADDAVIVSGVRPSYYAAELVHLAAQFRNARPALLNMPLNVPMAERAALEARVEAILAQTQQRSGVTMMDVLKITATGLIAAAALAFACPSLAQDAPQPPPAIAEPDAPPAPPAPVSQADLPAPPAPVAAPAAPSAPSETVLLLPPKGHHVRIIDERRTVDGHEVRSIHMYTDGRETPTDRAQEREDVARERADVANARAQARASEVEERQQIAAARAEARAAADAVRAERPRMEEALRDVRPQIESAIAEARAEIAKAHIDAKVQAKIDRALRRVVVRVDSRTDDNEDGDGHNVIIERSEARNGDVVIDRTENSDGK